jgi:tetratricopeptide (TPR) repeat protein
MSWIGVSALAALLLASNAITLALLLEGRSARRHSAGDPDLAGTPGAELAQVVASLGERIDRLAAASRREPQSDPGTGEAASVGNVGALLERLAAIEKRLEAMQTVDGELAAARLREEREARFRGEDGHVAADELLAEKQYALAASGYLKLLQHHPDNRDARSFLQRARDAYQNAGYTEKAFGVQQAILEKFPEHRGEDLMALAQMERDARRLDEAIQHAGEAVEAARLEEDRVWRLMYRAWFVQLRDGDIAGLQAYREVEQLAHSLGMGDNNPGKKVKSKITEIEERLVQGR